MEERKKESFYKWLIDSCDEERRMQRVKENMRRNKENGLESKGMKKTWQREGRERENIGMD